MTAEHVKPHVQQVLSQQSKDIKSQSDHKHKRMLQGCFTASAHPLFMQICRNFLSELHERFSRFYSLPYDIMSLKSG